MLKTTASPGTASGADDYKSQRMGDYGAMAANGKTINENQIATLSLEASEDRRAASRNE